MQFSISSPWFPLLNCRPFFLSRHFLLPSISDLARATLNSYPWFTGETTVPYCYTMVMVSVKFPEIMTTQLEGFQPTSRRGQPVMALKASKKKRFWQ